MDIEQLGSFVSQEFEANVWFFDFKTANDSSIRWSASVPLVNNAKKAYKLRRLVLCRNTQVWHEVTKSWLGSVDMSECKKSGLKFIATLMQSYPFKSSWFLRHAWSLAFGISGSNYHYQLVNCRLWSKQKSAIAFLNFLQSQAKCRIFLRIIGLSITSIGGTGCFVNSFISYQDSHIWPFLVYFCLDSCSVVSLFCLKRKLIKILWLVIYCF